MKISGIYKITNTVTGDFYIGSSKDVKQRWRSHKKPSTWKRCPNSPMYLDMKKYGTDKFDFQILEVVEIEQLKEIEQQFIETLKPTYNNYRANTGLGNLKGRVDEYKKEWYQKYKEEILDRAKQYNEAHKQQKEEYNNQLCCYNGEVLTLSALKTRFYRAGIPHPVLEAKKYLLNKSKDNIKE